ncbi:hypothetical protein ACQ86N_36850 [Puia sp. P3]|uniref:hypothetical protein n=1 Tax=Puia sp. P3 TaxID=3423952 RepID=UPI003D67221D
MSSSPEQYSANYLIKDSARLDLKLENLRMYDEIFRLHQTSREQFRKSYRYYIGRADLAQTLFDSLLNKGNRLRTESYSRPFRPVVTPPPSSVKTPATAPAKTPASAPATVRSGESRAHSFAAGFIAEEAFPSAVPKTAGFVDKEQKDSCLVVF